MCLLRFHNEGSGGCALSLDDHVGDEVRGLAGVGEGADGVLGSRGEAAVLLEAAPDLHRRLGEHQLVACERPPRRPQHRPVRRQPLRRRRHFSEEKRCGPAPNLVGVPEADLKRWFELTGRDANFSIPTEAGDFETWRNLPTAEFELDRPSTAAPAKSTSLAHHKKLLNGSGLNLSSTHASKHGLGDGLDIAAMCHKRRKDSSPSAMEEDCSNSNSDKVQDMDVSHTFEPSWMNDFSGVMRHASGPVTAAKTIYEDSKGYLIIISLPFADMEKVKVTWKNTLTGGIVKVSCTSVGRMPFLKRHDRTFKLADPSPEHCPPGEFVREIPLPTRIPEDATLEAYCDGTGTGLEIIVPKHRVGPEEHEVHVSLRPPSSWCQ